MRTTFLFWWYKTMSCPTPTSLSMRLTVHDRIPSAACFERICGKLCMFFRYFYLQGYSASICLFSFLRKKRGRKWKEEEAVINTNVGNKTKLVYHCYEKIRWGELICVLVFTLKLCLKGTLSTALVFMLKNGIPAQQCCQEVQYVPPH